jgi:hypothetical protein
VDAPAAIDGTMDAIDDVVLDDVDDAASLFACMVANASRSYRHIDASSFAVLVNNLGSASLHHTCDTRM